MVYGSIRGGERMAYLDDHKMLILLHSRNSQVQN